ncbi:MAG: response regulator receiver protein [Acidimicrobiaceae bacterium]|nr:response regulator receiver protein [Acidimicrobiaceae bacterium]
MANLVIVSDATGVLADVRAVVDDGENDIVEVRSGEQVRAVVHADPPDLVITDCQVQNMGGIAVALDLKLEESGGRLPHVPVLILLDRRADVFLAKRSAAEGYLVKPLDPIRLRRAVEALLEGGTFHDDSYKPLSVAATD